MVLKSNFLIIVLGIKTIGSYFCYPSFASVLGPILRSSVLLLKEFISKSANFSLMFQRYFSPPNVIAKSNTANCMQKKIFYHFVVFMFMSNQNFNTSQLYYLSDVCLVFVDKFI